MIAWLLCGGAVCGGAVGVRVLMRLLGMGCRLLSSPSVSRESRGAMIRVFFRGCMRVLLMSSSAVGPS